MRKVKERGTHPSSAATTESASLLYEKIKNTLSHQHRRIFVVPPLQRCASKRIWFLFSIFFYFGISSLQSRSKEAGANKSKILLCLLFFTKQPNINKRFCSLSRNYWKIVAIPCDWTERNEEMFVSFDFCALLPTIEKHKDRQTRDANSLLTVIRYYWNCMLNDYHYDFINRSERATCQKIKLMTTTNKKDSSWQNKLRQLNSAIL